MNDVLIHERGRGRGAKSFSEIPLKGWKDILLRTFRSISADRVMLVAGGGTFYVLLALVPALSVLISTYGLLFDPASLADHLALMSAFMPAAAIDLIRGQLERLTGQDSATLSFAFLFSLAIAIWSANSGMKGVFEAMNVAYNETESRNFFLLNAVSLLFTLGAVFAVICMVAVVIVTPVVLEFLHLGGLDPVIRIGGFAFLAVMMIFGLMLLYRYGPSRKNAQWKWLPVGAVAAVVLVMIVSVAFSYYVSNFADYNATYGSLGAIVGFMTLIWLTLTIVMLGAELNSEIEHQTAEDTTVRPEKPLGTRGAFVADHLGESTASQT
ncbi:YihY/virulence factor BrkB family protein [Notoacmeibacter ruber]|uniref:YihY/virulence factor BrkB family protein n=1 Tax=Notoacmeibacter ruber TaxID=2670375 RepID=A0A3L7JBC4_9HYPH|nr:YihY/virulence factor BrkB family protein [Notoacmeibacter ruber]RLQ88037.1 YihY/virulence factor BrkB family protein [Notoacmeibacter ruber]